MFLDGLKIVGVEKWQKLELLERIPLNLRHKTEHEAVSYTHLDVYKRQLWEGACVVY